MTLAKKHNVKIWGNGARSMIFAHGFGCDQNMWRFVSPSFEEDFCTILFDHVGAGQSDLSAYDQTKYSTLDGYADDVIDLCRELRVKDGVFVGHSVSAMIGVLAANKAPGIFSKLVLVAPSPRYINDGNYLGGFSEPQIHELLEFLDENYMGWSQAMAPAIMGNAERPELTDELTNSFCRTDPVIAKHFARTTFLSDNRLDLLKVTLNTLIIQCQEDVIAPQEVGEFMHRVIPTSELVLIDATGHCPNLSAPKETVEAIKSFLSRQ